MTIELTKKMFDTDVASGKGLALIDFWAPWCGPCRKQVPIIDDVAAAVGSKAIVAKVNVDEEPDLASQFEISSIPTIILFKDGKVIDRLSGLHSKEQLTTIIEKNI